MSRARPTVLGCASIVGDFAVGLSDRPVQVDVLQLHAMAHTLVNGAPLTTNVENLAIWELADALESELMEIEEGAKRAMKLLRPLLKLASDE